MNNSIAVQLPMPSGTSLSVKSQMARKTAHLTMDETRSSLLIRVQDPSDAASWQEFHDLYHPLLISFVKSKGIQDHNSAEDVVQEILIGLARRLPTLAIDKQRGRFRTYLWTAANNGVISWFRKNAKHSKSTGLDMDSRIAELEYETQSEPSVEFVTALRKRVLEQALLRIQESSNPDTWQCFQWHILEGTPARDVARQMDRSENTVYVNASRIMKKVSSLCGEYMEGLCDEIS